MVIVEHFLAQIYQLVGDCASTIRFHVYKGEFYIILWPNFFYKQQKHILVLENSNVSLTDLGVSIWKHCADSGGRQANLFAINCEKLRDL